MEEEIKATILEVLIDKGYSEEKAHEAYLKWKDGEVVDDIKQIGITVSFDVGWQKRGSGNRYDSISGHAIMNCCKTKKL